MSTSPRVHAHATCSKTRTDLHCLPPIGRGRVIQCTNRPRYRSESIPGRRSETLHRTAFLTSLCILLAAFLGAPLQADTVDQELSRFVREDMRNGVLDEVMPVVTKLGYAPTVLTVVTLGLVAGHALDDDVLHDASLLAGVGVVSSGIVTASLKVAVGRHRPTTPDDRKSMPSGHTTTAFAVATALSRSDPTWRVAFYGTAALVGFSRVYTGRHYVADVLAGAVIGIAITRLALTQEARILSVPF